MPNRNSLFWKIFVAIWLANLLVIALSLFFSLNTRFIHDEERQQRHIAEAISTTIGPYFDDDRQKLPRRFTRKPLRLLDEQGNVLIDGIRRHKKHKPLFDYAFTTPGGRQLTLQLPPPRSKKILHHYFRKTFVTRMLFVLIISGFVSYLLTRMITRPLKQLGEQTRAVAQGDLQAGIEQHLLQRRDEIGDLARESDAMLNSISQLLQSQQRLLHDVSHELRAPLARLMAALGLIQQRDDNNAMLQRIENECDTMNALIEQILHVARLENTQPKLESTDLNLLLQQIVEDCRFEFPEHTLQLRNSNEIAAITADPAMLTMAITNLVRNACQHTPAGSCVELTLTRTEQHWQLSVCDNGPGVDNETLQQLFTPFYRKGSGNGFGLGLNISQRAVEKHQGRIHASHNQPHGLCFNIELPLS